MKSRKPPQTSWKEEPVQREASEDIPKPEEPANKDVFLPRASLLDFGSFSASKNEHRGFFTFFWVGIFVYMINTLYSNWKAIGSPISLSLAVRLTEDIFNLVLLDICMVGFTFVAPLIQKGVVAGVIPLKLSVFLKHSAQTFLIFGSIFVIVGRDWPWVQSGSFFIHTMVLYMKMHSYLSSNYDLHVQSMVRKKTDEPIISSAGIECPRYPANVTFSNYLYYLLVPTLVYEPAYPKTDRIRVSYLAEKAIYAILSMFLLYVTIEHYILEILQRSAEMTAHESVLLLLLPFMVCYIMMFFVIFECICNWMAEITKFADRQFYSDWWNRKWNKPVHQFFLRHIYKESIKTYKFSKHRATFVTFLFSSLLHELVLTVIGRRVLMYMFILQMIQIPLIYLGRTRLFRERPLAGNILFWGGITLGLPLLSVLYCRQHFLEA